MKEEEEEEEEEGEQDAPLLAGLLLDWGGAPHSLLPLWLHVTSLILPSARGSCDGARRPRGHPADQVQAGARGQLGPSAWTLPPPLHQHLLLLNYTTATSSSSCFSTSSSSFSSLPLLPSHPPLHLLHLSRLRKTT